MTEELLNDEHLASITIESEMKKSYLDYAMSVIVSRAIPDACDGLKPVHRRILYAMYESGYDFNKPFKKSARIVGEVMGKYHPHGDAAIYDALVRMAQDFSMGVTLIDGQGNFGSIDDDPPAAMRYTESRLAKISHTMLVDLDKATVPFAENYDGSETQPSVLPASFPNLLVNGSGGIAVGMATNIPPYNLGEVIDATIALIDNPEITSDEIIQIIPAPDFPTAAIILGRAGSISAAKTGRGSVVMRGKTEIEEITRGKQAIIITEIPYQVNKAHMIEKIAELVRDKKIEGITDLRDESDKSGIRVVVEVRKDISADVVLNQLYSYTQLQTSFGVNMLALNHGRPELLNIPTVLRLFVEFRSGLVRKRTEFLLDKARNKAHLLIGLRAAVDNIDEIIRLIRASANPVEAKEQLLSRAWRATAVAELIALVQDHGNRLVGDEFFFTETQARAILEMRLSKLTSLESEKINNELKELATEIAEYLSILASNEKLMAIIKAELLAIKTEFAVPRRSVIEEFGGDQTMEDLIQREDMVITMTLNGYIKRVPLATYRSQKRGGKGRGGISMHEEDVATDIIVASTHATILFFSNIGKVYSSKGYKLPLGTPQTKGRSIINILPLAASEKITTVLALPEGLSNEELDQQRLIFATANGNIRKNTLADFSNIMANGKIAIGLGDDDSLIGVKIALEDEHIFLNASGGKCLRCPVSSVRLFKGRKSTGVRGVRLVKGDHVISLSILRGGEIAIDTREEYLKIPVATRIAIANGKADMFMMDSIKGNNLPQPEIESLAMREEFILSITENGFGKRSSAFEYRITNRGGSGIVSILTSARNGKVVASFPVIASDQVMIVTDSGTMIRCPVSDIRIAGRSTQGVTLLRTDAKEKVVSVAVINGNDCDDEGD